MIAAVVVVGLIKQKKSARIKCDIAMLKIIHV
jgi:hypothetical protein